MTSEQGANANNTKNTLAFLLAAKPTAPLPSKRSYSEKLFDPSAAVPRGCSYPVPTSFEYRVRPEEE
jgi:hypothetical protein